MVKQMTEETKHAIEQYLTESEYFESIANTYGKELLNKVVHDMITSKHDIELLMSLYEDSGMWNHAMCLNDITVSK